MNCDNELFRDAKAVTPDDDAEIISGVPVVSALWVGSTGNLTVVTEYGSTVTITNIANGTFIPLRCKRVLESTTASDVVAFV